VNSVRLSQSGALGDGWDNVVTVRPNHFSADGINDGATPRNRPLSIQH
jgi:hypothetical protein